MLKRSIALGFGVWALLSMGMAQAAPTPQATLSAYAGEAEMVQALTRWRAQAEALRPRARRESAGNLAMSVAESSQAPSPAAAPQGLAKDKAADAATAGESITNVQTAGVDEGGIVKRAGDHLVMTRWSPARAVVHGSGGRRRTAARGHGRRLRPQC
jgi:uncharacterized secreted protein with C-terminal beta-propeller domain